MKTGTKTKATVFILLACLFISGCDKKTADSSPSPVLTESVDITDANTPALTNAVSVPLSTTPAAQIETGAAGQNPAATDSGYTIILTDGLPGPNETQAANIRETFNVELVFNALANKKTDLYSAIADTDLALVSRRDMAALAAGGYIEDITDAALGFGIPEGYYSAGWVNGRIYGFTVTPATGDGLLIYNADVLEDCGVLNLPGALFDMGFWNRRDFFDYCQALVENLPEGTTVIDADPATLFLGIVYANGGYVNNPETGAAMYTTGIVRESLTYLQSLAQAGILTRIVKGESPGDAFADGEACFTVGNAADIDRYLGLGLTVGVVPYPWGGNVKVNPQAASIDDMLLYGYRTAFAAADLFVITKSPDVADVGKGGALTKATANQYIDIVFTYLLDEGTEMRSNMERERQGLWAVSPRFIPDGLDEANLLRYRWYVSRPAAVIPANAGEELFFLELAECVFGGWNVAQWTQSVTPVID